MSSRRVALLDAYGDGLRGVEQAAGHVRDWSAATPCSHWQAVDLAGHLLAIAQYFWDLLDAVDVGRPRTGLPRGSSLETMNARDLAALAPGRGPDRVAAFLQLARRYGERVAEAPWDSVIGEWEDIGPLTVAQHAGLAVGEWHIHAWDLAQSAGGDHRPADPAAVAAGRSILKNSMPPDADPWRATLIGAGRRPIAPNPESEPRPGNDDLAEP